MDKFDRLLLLDGVKNIDILQNELMSAHTSFRVGGAARLFARPATEEQLCSLLCAARDYDVPCLVMGNGTDLLVRDGGISALVIQIGDAMSDIRIDGLDVYAQAGALLSTVSKRALKAGLGGLEWAGGIPGTIGGAAAMNAGAYGGELKQVLKTVTVVENGKLHQYEVHPEDMGYRTSLFCAPERIVTSAVLTLVPDDGHAAERQEDYARRRREKQPLSFPSAGSTFKRPEGYFAGALIEKSGLKGTRVGGAQVSELHAGFVINTGGATAADIIGLIELVRARVFSDSGVLLEPEVKMIGEDG